jgi:cytoskeleton protein RodZ
LPAESSQQFGEELRRDRELRDVTREQLAVVTKVSLRHLTALETGRFEQLPALVFTRGFVRSIALHLGLDPERTVAAYAHVYRAWEEEERKRRESEAIASGTHPMLRVRPRRSRATGTTLALAATVAVLLVGTVGAALFKSRPAPPSAARTPSDRPESGPASLALPAAIAAAAVPLPPERAAASPAEIAVAPASRPPAPASRPAAVPAAVPAAAAPGLSGSRLTLTFRDDCWTEVSVDGKVVAAELFRKGATREFSGGRRFVLTLGNAGGVDVAVDGRVIQALGRPGEVVRDVPIEPKRG